MRSRLSVIAVVVLSAAGLGAGVSWASIPAPNGVIHSCYKTRTGALSVINSARVHRCPPGSKSLNWNQKGRAGTARDAGDVFPLTPAFQKEGLKGWRSVTRTAVGDFCLTPDASSTVSNTSLVLSLGGPGSGVPGFIVWAGYCSEKPLQLAVLTYDGSGQLSNNVAFEAVIP